MNWERMDSVSCCSWRACRRLLRAETACCWSSCSGVFLDMAAFYLLISVDSIRSMRFNMEYNCPRLIMRSLYCSTAAAAKGVFWIFSKLNPKRSSNVFSSVLSCMIIAHVNL